MPSITFDKFDVGLDLRKGEAVSDANRMRVLNNAYVTTGKALAKRNGLTKIATLESGTKGLVPGLGKLQTFYDSGSIVHANTLFNANKVSHPTTPQAITRIPRGDVFQKFVYVSVVYADGSIWHHYLDGSSPTHISDTNCPQSEEWIKLASKIWAIGDEVVAFSATNLPRNWTLSDDAGFLPTGLQHRGGFQVQALGQYKKDLVTLFSDGGQIWVVDPDPALHVLKDTIDVIGTRYPDSLGKVSGDLFLLSDFGFRSISNVGQNDNIADVDVGSPIDTKVKPLLTGNINPLAAYHSALGQYLCFIGQQAFVYGFSRTIKISAWAEHSYPWTFSDVANLDGDLYLRSGDDVYKVDDAIYTDDGQTYEMRIEMPFLDFKRSGVLKHLYGIDAAIEGSANIQIKWKDGYGGEGITDPVPLTGDTRPGELAGIDLTAVAFAPVITSTSSEAVRLDALTFYFNELGVL